MRIPIMAGNWKMYKTATEAVDFVARLKKELGNWDKTEVVVAPSFVALAPVVNASRTTIAVPRTALGRTGAYTKVSCRCGCGCHMIIGTGAQGHFGERHRSTRR
jgi:triosephosphate isomerase